MLNLLKVPPILFRVSVVYFSVASSNQVLKYCIRIVYGNCKVQGVEREALTPQTSTCLPHILGRELLIHRLVVCLLFLESSTTTFINDFNKRKFHISNLPFVQNVANNNASDCGGGILPLHDQHLLSKCLKRKTAI